jgi:sugar transferase (PEP-CTERM system associated)
VLLHFGLLALIEALCLVLSFYAGVYIRFAGDLTAAQLSVGVLVPRAVVFAVCVALGLLAVGLYRVQPSFARGETFLRICAGLLLGGFANMAVFYVIPGVFTGRGSLAVALLAALIIIGLVRYVFYALIGSRGLRKNILVLGRGTVASSLARLCGGLGQSSFDIVGYIAAPCDNVSLSSACVPLIKEPESLLACSRENRVDELVVALDNRREYFPARMLLDCRINGLKVTEALTFIERETGKLDLRTLRPAWLIFERGFRHGSRSRVLKRVFDLVSASALLCIVFPALLVAALGILVESKGRGGLLYRQRRVGLRGETFEMLKLRSMVPDAEEHSGPQWSSGDDPRVTRMGVLIRRLRIDELPQIFNILRGDMSFVGPRPERPEFVDDLMDEIPFYDERHCVKPGLTGWAQLCYPYGASVEDARQKLQYDLYYVKNQGLLFDLLILLQTLDVVIWGRKQTEEPEIHVGDAVSSNPKHAA